MAYYMLPYKPARCCVMYCDKQATVEVFTSGTQSYGFYCKKHGEKRCKEGNELIKKGADF
jgi:hypothetical protein